MSGLKNILVIWHLFESFPNKFVMCGVTIKSPIESPMVSPAILNSSGSRVQDWPYRRYLYPPKTNYISRFQWPGMTSIVSKDYWRETFTLRNCLGIKIKTSTHNRTAQRGQVRNIMGQRKQSRKVKYCDFYLIFAFFLFPGDLSTLF